MNSNRNSFDVTLVVLAGGEGRRMGIPKGNLRIGSTPILEHLLDKFCWSGPTLLVTAPGREQPSGSDEFDREVVDSVPNEGPLRGVLTALQHIDTSLCVVATVDMPGIQLDQLNWLMTRLGTGLQTVGVMASRRMDRTVKIEPFPLACSVQAKESIERQLLRHRRSMHSLAELPGFVVEPAPDNWPMSVWSNLNHPEDLRDYVQHHSMD